jgi:hypothetical protein
MSSATMISPHAIDKNHNHNGSADEISRAALTPLHTSTTESILAWPQFREFGVLRQEHSKSVFQLESSRPSLPLSTHTMHPYASEEEVAEIVQSFEMNVNFWYPTMTRSVTIELQQRILSGLLDDSTNSCLAYLIMALGCATQLVHAITENVTSNMDEKAATRKYRAMSKMYFDIALKKIHIAQSECSKEATQCLFFTA